MESPGAPVDMAPDTGTMASVSVTTSEAEDTRLSASRKDIANSGNNFQTFEQC